MQLSPSTDNCLDEISVSIHLFDLLEQFFRAGDTVIDAAWTAAPIDNKGSRDAEDTPIIGPVRAGGGLRPANPG